MILYKLLFLFIIRLSQPGLWEAYLGLHVQQNIKKTVEVRNLKRIIPHPNYNQYTFDNDIALMEMDSPVSFSAYIQPICLPAPQHDFPVGETVWITGWGATREAGELAINIELFGLINNCNHRHNSIKESTLVQTQATFQDNQ